MDKSSENLFVTGKAGTGKSYVLKTFIAHTSKNVAKVAPTGIAAINIGGQTIHSFFGMSTGVQNPDDMESVKLNSEKTEILQKLDILIIDEISMVRADVMDMIDAKLKLARKKPLLPFGGCRIIAFGDLYQLPPVVGKDDGVRNYLHDRYSTEFFFAAPAVQNNPFRIVELNEVVRQKGDSVFIDILNRVRIGECASDILKTLNERCMKPPVDEDILTLTPGREAAQDVNHSKLEELEAEEHVYNGIREGDFQIDDMPTDARLKLKVGAQVMMIKNDRDGRWVNGTMGHIHSLAKDSIEVEIEGKRVYTIDMETWTKQEYVYNSEKHMLEQKTTGSFKQFPIKLAYAITIHKSQGQTYSSVCVDYSAGHAFAAGQTYVALSRCSALSGLYLSVPLTQEDISVSAEVQRFMRGEFQSSIKKVSYNETYITQRAEKHINLRMEGTNRLRIDPPQSPKKLTGTRLAAVLGMDRYKTPFEVWCEIVHVYEKPFEENESTRAGKIIQPKQFTYVQSKYGNRTEVARPEDVFGPDPEKQTGFDFFRDSEIFGGMWDYLARRENEDMGVFEMKTTRSKNRVQWQNGAPENYKLQAALYAYLLGVKHFCMVASFIEPDQYADPTAYVCGPDNTIIRWYNMAETFADFETRYIARAREWWKKHIETGISPEYDVLKDAKVLSDIRERYPELITRAQ